MQMNTNRSVHRSDWSASRSWLTGAGILLILSAALFRGGNRWVPLAALILLGLLVLLTSLLSSRPELHHFREHHPWRLSALWTLGTAPFWIAAIQLVPLPFHWVQGLPGHEVRGWSVAALGVQEPGAVPLTLLPDLTWLAALAAIPVVASFVLALNASERHIRLLLWVWLGTAIFQSVFGLFQLIEPSLYFSERPGTFAQGTFGNRNSFANYLAMLLPVALWFVIAAVEGRGFVRGRHRSGTWRTGPWPGLAALMVLLSGLVASLSRAGIATGTFVLLLALLTVWWRKGEGGSRRGDSRWIVLLPFVLLAFAMASGGWAWLERFETGDGQRVLNWADSLQAGKQYWPLGSGLGTYGAVFPAFQSAELGAYYVNYAHNDPLQLIVEAGAMVIPPAVALLTLLVLRVLQLVGSVGRSGGLTKKDMLPVVCGLGFLAQLLHVWVDFPWHIPATAMLGAFLLGVFLRSSRDLPSPLSEG